MGHEPINPAGKSCFFAATPAENTFRAGPTPRFVTFAPRRSRLPTPSKHAMRGPAYVPLLGLPESRTAVSHSGNSAFRLLARGSSPLFPPKETATLEGDEVYTRVHHNTPASESEGWTGWFRDRATGWWGPTVVGLRRESLFTTLILAVWLWAQACFRLTLVTDGEAQYSLALWLQDGTTAWVGGHHTGKRGRPPGMRKVLRLGLVVARKVKGSQQGPRKRERYERPLPLHPDTPNIPDKAIHANHCEAFHAALRRMSAVFHRRMNHYAKKPEGLVRALAVQQVAHNWLTPKEAGKETPAMKRGLTDRPWRFYDVLVWRYQPKSRVISVSLIT